MESPVNHCGTIAEPQISRVRRVRSADSNRTALVLGATGSIGSEVARALLAHGWCVRALHRRPETAASHLPGAPVQWLQGNASDAANVIDAASGASLIFHGVNPPGYRNWRGLGIPMLANSIAAAKSVDARLIFPCNVYNFGSDAWPVLHENSQQTPITAKGAVRVEMERMLEAATADGVRSLVLRAGDFFGPHARSSWLSGAMVKPGRPVKAMIYPGDPQVGHAWAYLPDVAETVAQLAELEATLPDFDVLNFGGHWVDPGIEMAHAVGRAVGDSSLPIRPLPWTLLRLAAPFNTFYREMIEMRYLWRVPVCLDNSKLVALTGKEPHTPLGEAVRKSLDLSLIYQNPAGAPGDICTETDWFVFIRTSGRVEPSDRAQTR
jgi:nucleoside-diphosphate-sugar epimerase